MISRKSVASLHSSNRGAVVSQFFLDLQCFSPLDPALSENESFDLLKVCVNSVFSLPPETHTPEKTKEDDILDPKQRQVK